MRAFRKLVTPLSPGDRFVELRGMRPRVTIQGHGPPLLLINGLGANIEMWEPLRRQLTGRQTIAFDAPGTGASDRPIAPLRMRDLAGIVNELLDKLGYTAVDVLGYSFGGAVALQLSHQHPQRVRRLVLAATMPGLGAVQNPVALMGLISLPLLDGHAPAHAQALARIVGGRAARDALALATVEAAHQARPPNRTGFAHQLMAMAGWTSMTWLHTVTVPTLVIAGEQDPLVPAINNKIFTSMMPNCREHVVAGAGHLFLIDQPEDAVGAIESFLAPRRATTARSSNKSTRATRVLSEP
jgi:poly(3-hydroxyoctanoate) depolymerase